MGLSSLARLVHVLAVIAAAPAVLSAQAYRVGGPRADFDTIQEGVDASPEGGIVLVSPGQYGGSSPATVIDGRSVTLATRKEGRRVRVQGGLVIRNLAPDQSVTLVGFDYEAIDSVGALTVTDCEGTVWLEDCTFNGFEVSFFEDPTAVHLSNANDVIFVRSEVVAGGNSVMGPTSGRGIRSIGSSLHLFDTNVVGGRARSSSDIDGFPGGDGITLDGGFLFARNGVLTGGEGGYVGTPFGCANLVGGEGGPGLRLTGTDPEAFLVAMTLVSGEGGGATPPCIPGDPGPPLVVEAGSVSTHGEIPRGITAPSLISPFEPTPLTITGIEGEPAWLLISEEPMTNFVAAQLGTEVLDDFVQIYVGQIGLSHDLTTMLPPVLATTLYPEWYGGTRIYVQSLTMETGSGGLMLGSPTAIVVRPPESQGDFLHERGAAQPR